MNRVSFCWRWIVVTALLGSLAVGSGCAPTIALYSPTAYEQAVELKVETLALLRHATEPYSSYQADVDALLLELEIAREYARGRPKNTVSTRQWEVMMNPADGLLGDLLARWQSGTAIGETYLAEKQKQIAAAFDLIIGLESRKINPSSLTARQP